MAEKKEIRPITVTYKRTRTGKPTAESEMMAMKTTSHVPKSAREKKMWIQARRFVARTVGRYKEKEIPWGLVQKIYEDQVKSGHTMSDEDIRKAKIYKTIRKYETPAKKAKARKDESRGMKARTKKMREMKAKYR